MTHTNFRPHGDKYYVRPHPRGWAVECEKKSPVSYSYNKKDEAIDTAESLAKEHHADVVIQKQDGSVEKKLSFR
jgi:hypothetical protein